MLLWSRSHDDQAGLQSSSTGFSRGLVTEAKHNDTKRTISRQPTSSSSNARPKITGWTVGEPAHDNDLNPACRAATPCLSSLEIKIQRVSIYQLIGHVPLTTSVRLQPTTRSAEV